MKLKFALFMFIGILPVLSHAQGCITVFSEDGDKFYLVLNGVKQNPTPQTNVRVDGLTNDFYSAKVLFEDQAKGELSKNIPTKDAATSQFAEVTYKIKHTKDGDLKMRFFSATPVPVNYNPPPDMYVAHYGQPAATVTQTTITTTNTAVNPNTGNNGGANISIGGAGVNMSINVSDPNNGNGGVNMNMNVSDPNQMNGNVSTTQTTTTRTTTTTSDNYSNNTAYASAPPPACQYPMDMGSFRSAKETVGKASFEDTKLSTAKTILSSNCMSTTQIMEICKMFSFEATKLDFAKFAYPKSTDPGNYFKVGSVFGYDASKTELNDYISSHQR